MKKIVAISLTLVGILSAGATETLAAPLVVEQGFFFNSIFLGSGQNDGAFSGDNFAVTIFATGTGVFGEVFTTGIWDVVFERGSNYLGGTIQVGDVSCQSHPYPPDPAGPACSGTLRFISQPLTLVPDIVHEAPFTMTGQLVLGRLGLPDLIVDIEGSGIVSGMVHTGVFPFPTPGPATAYSADYRFGVPEPSTVVLVLSGLVAVGWSRRRGKHLPLYPDAEPGRVA